MEIAASDAQVPIVLRVGATAFGFQISHILHSKIDFHVIFSTNSAGFTSGFAHVPLHNTQRARTDPIIACTGLKLIFALVER
jgi:hypothetical protein